MKIRQHGLSLSIETSAQGIQGLEVVARSRAFVVFNSGLRITQDSGNQRRYPSYEIQQARAVP